MATSLSGSALRSPTDTHGANTQPPHPEPDPSVLPEFVLLAPPPRNPDAPSLCTAWRAALADVLSPVAERFAVKEARLDPTALAREFGRCECVVSPANAFGIMDGGYDLALSHAFAIDGDTWALTNAAQATLRDRYRGYLPPGSCALVPLPPALTASNELECTLLAVVPTMRTPEDVSWHVDLVYECMWNLLSALWRWNAGERPAGAGRVERVLMTGLGTGSGGVSYERCARQIALAALNFARGWGERPRWGDVKTRTEEMDRTRRV
ncbi:macro domain-like protein [Trametes meyenii]|nr:macro domain-like protein [Trametes meyenii]